MLPMLTSAMAATASHHLTMREALSGIWGSISLCAWIFLLVSLSDLETHRSVVLATHPTAIGVWTSLYSSASCDQWSCSTYNYMQLSVHSLCDGETRA